MYTRVFPRHTRLKRAPHSVAQSLCTCPRCPRARPCRVCRVLCSAVTRVLCTFHHAVPVRSCYIVSPGPPHTPSSCCVRTSLRSADGCALCAPRARRARPAPRRAPRAAPCAPTLAVARAGSRACCMDGKTRTPDTNTQNRIMQQRTVYFIGFDFIVSARRGRGSEARALTNGTAVSVLLKVYKYTPPLA